MITLEGRQPRAESSFSSLPAYFFPSLFPFAKHAAVAMAVESKVKNNNNNNNHHPKNTQRSREACLSPDVPHKHLEKAVNLFIRLLTEEENIGVLTVKLREVTPG